MNVAIIPARGGSKRISKKNIREFCGKPIIHYSIHAAQKSGVFDRIIVSTDSEEIAAVARQAGAEVPFERPAHLADDHTMTAPVLEHAVEWLIHEGVVPDYFCCIYATAPFVQPRYLVEGYQLVEGGAVSAMSVTSFGFPIYRGMLISDTTGEVSFIWPENELVRSQDLPDSCHDAAQLYWFDVPRFRVHRSLYPEGQRPVILPRHMVQDIDTLEDWETAEAMYRSLGLGRKGQGIGPRD